MATYKYYELDINEEQTFSLVNETSKEINLPITPTRGSLIYIDDKLYSVIDIIQHDNSTPILTLLNVEEDVPTIYKTIIKNW